MNKTLMASIALALASVAHTTHAEVSTGHWAVTGSDTTLSFALFQDSADTDVTYLYANVETSSLSPSYAVRQITGNMFTLDAAADLYVVQAGDLLTNALLEAGTYPALIGPTNGAPYTGDPSTYQPWPTLTVIDNTEFWIGARIRSGNIGDQPWTGFGWAHLRFEDNGGVTLLGSAMAYGESSLVVGAVPEPQTWALMSAGLGLTALAVRRQRRAKAKLSGS